MVKLVEAGHRANSAGTFGGPSKLDFVHVILSGSKWFQHQPCWQG